MKRDAGWATAIVALATGMSLVAAKGGGPEAVGRAAAGSVAPSGAPQTSADPYPGTCHELRSTLGAFLHRKEENVPAPESCKPATIEPNDSGGAPQPTDDSGGGRPKARFVIATLADPTHTHLPLLFDRDAEAIQEAAADSGYVFDSSWFPWETDAVEHPLIADQDVADVRKEDREDQPGVLLFRKATKKADFSDPYEDVLIVFVVGEQPTAGIHRGQFENAVRWITQLGTLVDQNSKVQILGPSFSGSLPSLKELLSQPDVGKELTRGGTLEIKSGHVNSGMSVDWFANRPPIPLEFQSFQEDEETVLTRYKGYLRDLHIGLCHVAIVSEDETAYGQQMSGTNGKPPDPAPPASARDKDQDCEKFAYFFYPRDIAAVRTAYQEQSLFTLGSSRDGTDLGRRTLRADLADPAGKEHDTIQSYGANQTVLSQEGVLLQLVNMMRMHRTYFIVLRSSNPLDQLFLAHFFQMTYPEGRVVFIGADLLLRRDLGSGGLNGAMMLSTYPLLPDIDHWTRRDDGSATHSHRAIPQASAQGVYMAMRFLLPRNGTTDNIGQLPCDSRVGSEHFLPSNQASSGLRFLPAYSNPAWFGTRTCRPVTWLTVLGNDGFWPVASLDDNLGQGDSKVPDRTPVSERATFRPVPLSMNIAILAAIGWMAFHVACCWWPSVTMKPDHRSYFVRMRRYRPTAVRSFSRRLLGRFAHTAVRRWGKLAPLVYACDPELLSPRTGAPGAAVTTVRPKSQLALIVGMSVIIVCAVFLLASGWGWMSGGGAPIPHPVGYGLIPLMVWVMGLSAVLGNSLVETVLPLLEERGLSFSVVWKKAAARRYLLLRGLWSSSLPVASYAMVTCGFYCFYLLLVDGTLPPQVRTLSYLRAMKLTAGVSPVVPMIFLAVGMYGWCWSSLRGLALFGADRPRLPKRNRLLIPVDKPPVTPVALLAMLSQEGSADPIEKLSWPFHRRTWQHAAIALLTILIGAALLGDTIPIRSLGTQHYSGLIWVWIAINASVLLANAWQLMHLWLKLKSLLIFLDKLPLRRTMRAIDEFTWGSIWRIGGNVLDWRYKLFYREFETLNHLQSAFEEMKGGHHLAAPWIRKIEDSRKTRIAFQEWSSENWNKWSSRDLSKLRDAQRSMARLCGHMIVEILLPAWKEEKESLLIAGQPGAAEDGHGQPIVGLKPYVRHAEEAVCLLYLGFIQNVLGRMRTLVMAMVCLFLSIAFVVPSYPFDPRPLLTGGVIALFLAVGATVFTVYSQMFRDATLSHLTNTRPGELGSEFWLKLLGFGAGPVLGLVATVFPEFSTALFSWLQPSLSSIK